MFRKKRFSKLKDNEKKNQNLYMVLLFVSIICFAFLYYNRAATDWEGPDNFCALLMKNGKMIYRDFFYYIPPVYILRCLITWFLFQGEILPLRLLGIAERALLFVIIYRILIRWFKPYISYIACFLGFLLYNSLTFNSYGDYTQYSQIFAALVVYCVIKFDEKERNGNKKGMYWLAAASFLLVQSVMSKQSIGAGIILFMFAALIAYSIIRKAGIKFINYFLAALLGAVVGILPYLIWFLCTGSLMDFINQVFLLSLNSKGLSTAKNTSHETSLLLRVCKAIFYKDSIGFDCFLLLSLVIGFISKIQRGRIKKGLQILRWFFLIGSLYFAGKILGIGSVYHNLKNTFLFLEETYLLYYLIGIIFVIVIGWKIYSKERNVLKAERERIIVTIFTGIALLCGITASFLSIEDLKRILDLFNMNETLSGLYELSFHICNVLLAAELFRKIVLKKNKYPLVMLCYLAALNGNCIISLIGGGSATFSANGSLFTIPLVVCLLCSVSNNKKNCPKWEVSLKYVPIVIIGLFTFLLTGITMGQHLYVPYSWYGWVSEPISDETSYTIDFERYTGLLVSKKTKVTLEEVTKLITLNSSGDDDFIFTFPGGKIYNILSENVNMPTDVVYYMFDVCPDNYAIADAKILKENKPDIIVWKDLGEETWQIFEEQYRNGGKLGQRKIQEWFDSVKNTEYTLVGQVYNESVYVKNDGRKINYTSFVSGENMISDINEVHDNIHKSNVINRMIEVLFPASVSNVNILYIGILVFSILIFWFLCRYTKDFTVPLLAMTILSGYLLHTSFVYYFIMIIPLLLWSFNGLRKNYISNVLHICNMLAISLLLLQWLPSWSWIKFVFYGLTIVMLVLSVLNSIFNIYSKKNAGKVKC